MSVRSIAATALRCKLPDSRVSAQRPDLNRGKASQKLVHKPAMAVDESRQLDFIRLLPVVFDNIDEVGPN